MSYAEPARKGCSYAFRLGMQGASYPPWRIFRRTLPKFKRTLVGFLSRMPLLLFHRQSVVLCQSAEKIHLLHNEARIPGQNKSVDMEVSEPDQPEAVSNEEIYRINACDEVEGGQSVQDAAAVAAYLEQECGVDYALADDTQGTLRGFDNIVLAMGSRANSDIEEIAEKTAEKIAKRVIVIGETFRSPGNAVMAVNDALRLLCRFRTISGNPWQFNYRDEIAGLYFIKSMYRMD